MAAELTASALDVGRVPGLQLDWDSAGSELTSVLLSLFSTDPGGWAQRQCPPVRDCAGGRAWPCPPGYGLLQGPRAALHHVRKAGKALWALDIRLAAKYWPTGGQLHRADLMDGPVCVLLVLLPGD